MTLNVGSEFDAGRIQRVRVNLPCIRRRVNNLKTTRTVKKKWQAEWLVRAVECIDLTTLAGDDTCTNVERLCKKALTPIRPDLLKKVTHEPVTTGAVCVYTARVAQARKIVANKIPVAAVATGFPSGQLLHKQRIMEIEVAVAEGASEIDIVVPRELVLGQRWQELYDEVKACKKACGHAHMKTILAIGECGSLQNVYKASLVSMMAGSDFIKTSTGKEGVNAILEAGLVMARAIREYYDYTGYQVGFKPAGGVRTAKDSLMWLILMKEELGDDWLEPRLFRIGASGLLIDIERQLYHFAYGAYAAEHHMAMS
eukprot:GEMP01050650.1.p1 GENE.GEMP01050650.1~~GEMP01050650.1.p1  ORF type:complete len:313 (+),score=70.47 GEMP01050650.1:42-980(+)